MSQFPALFLFSPCLLFSSLPRVLFDNDKNISYSRGSLSRPNSTLFIPGFLRSRSRPRLMKRRTVGSRKPIFEKDGLSLEIYCYIYISLSLSTYLPSTSIVLRESCASVFLFARGFTKEPGQCRGNLSIIITG